MVSANLRVNTEWKWPCNLLGGHLMKQNVFIYFPGCISSCNMFPSEAQGCRFMFEVVFNHPFAIEITFVLRIWASQGYRTRSTLEYLPIAHETLSFKLCDIEEWVLKNLNTQKYWRTVKNSRPHHPSPGLRRFVQTCCGCLEQPPPPPSSPVLNTFTNHIPPDIPPPAILPHPRPISPHFQASS